MSIHKFRITPRSSLQQSENKKLRSTFTSKWTDPYNDILLPTLTTWSDRLGNMNKSKQCDEQLQQKTISLHSHFFGFGLWTWRLKIFPWINDLGNHFWIRTIEICHPTETQSSKNGIAQISARCWNVAQPPIGGSTDYHILTHGSTCSAKWWLLLRFTLIASICKLKAMMQTEKVIHYVLSQRFWTPIYVTRTLQCAQNILTHSSFSKRYKFR